MKATHAGLKHKDRVIHMFHIFAKILEVIPDNTVKQIPKIPITELKPSDILANEGHFQELKEVFIVLVLRIATKRIPQLNQYAKYIVKHIKHKYSDVLRHASVTVRIQ